MIDEKVLIKRLMFASAGCRVYKLINPNIEDVTEFNAYKKCIEIVKDLAEEHNNGWIPCSERLPEFDGAYICTANDCQESLELIYSIWDNSWMDEFDSEYEVIAWQPLPAPYRKGE